MWNKTEGCAWSLKRLPLLVDDELIGAERRRVERHLIGCANCRERLESHRANLALLHIAAVEEPGAGSFVRDRSDSVLWPAIARQIRESRREPARSSWGGWGSPGFIGVAAGITIAIVATLVPRTASPRRVEHIVAPVASPVVAAAPDHDLSVDTSNDELITQNRLAEPKHVVKEAAAKPRSTTLVEPSATVRFDLDSGAPMIPGAADTQRAY
jgi:anti-sigma factor RsiW